MIHIVLEDVEEHQFSSEEVAEPAILLSLGGEHSVNLLVAHFVSLVCTLDNTNPLSVLHGFLHAGNPVSVLHGFLQAGQGCVVLSLAREVGDGGSSCNFFIEL